MCFQETEKPSATGQEEIAFGRNVPHLQKRLVPLALSTQATTISVMLTIVGRTEPAGFDRRSS